MADSAKCLKCGGTNLKPGELRSGLDLFPISAFRLNTGKRALFDKTPAVLLNAAMCLDCGFVEILGDPGAAKAIVKKIEKE